MGRRTLCDETKPYLMAETFGSQPVCMSFQSGDNGKDYNDVKVRRRDGTWRLSDRDAGSARRAGVKCHCISRGHAAGIAEIMGQYPPPFQTLLHSYLVTVLHFSSFVFAALVLSCFSRFTFSLHSVLPLFFLCPVLYLYFSRRLLSPVPVALYLTFLRHLPYLHLILSSLFDSCHVCLLSLSLSLSSDRHSSVHLHAPPFLSE